MKLEPIPTEELEESISKLELMFPREVLAKHHGKIHPDQRTGSVIVAAIKTATLTVNEMGNILGAITERICGTALGEYPENPELESVAHDLSETCEEFTAAQDRIDERKCNMECHEIEEGDWK